MRTHGRREPIGRLPLAISIALLGAAGNDPPRAAAPGAVGNTVRLSQNQGSGETTISWDAIPDATSYDTYLGSIPEDTMGGRRPGSYELVSRSGGGGQFAPCPGTKKVVGGGADGTAHLWASRPEPPGTGWYASAGGPFVVAYAICAEVGASYQIVSASGGAGQFVPCPGSKKVIGGGADGSSPLVSSRPEPPGTGWYASAGGPFVAAYAICSDVDSSYGIVSSSGGGDQLASCPGAASVVGGGAESISLFYLSRPQPPGIGWYASAGGPFVLAYAICAAAPYDHACHEPGDALGDGATASTLTVSPPVGGTFYVLVAGRNASGEGSLGAGKARDGSPIPRTTSTLCPAPP